MRRFVFLSSFSSRADAHSYYGRSKHALEQELDPERDLILRPGLVLAAGAGGLFQRLCTAVERATLVPVFGGGRQVVQTVHVQDLCLCLERALDMDLTGALDVAEPDGLTYAQLLREIRARTGGRCHLVPLPLHPVLWALRVSEALRLPAPVTSENLQGLRGLRHVDTRPDLERLQLELRTASESLDAVLGPAPR